MDHLGLVAGLQVPEDGRVVEESQVDHVLALLELGRVDPAHLRLLVRELLVTDSLGSSVHSSLFAITVTPKKHFGSSRSGEMKSRKCF